MGFTWSVEGRGMARVRARVRVCLVGGGLREEGGRLGVRGRG